MMIPETRKQQKVQEEKIMAEGLIKATELAYKVGASVQTISMWYKFKEENPDSEYSHMLPDFVCIGANRTRYWKASDVEKLIIFRNSIPRGRNGVLGSVTQRYVGKSKENDGTVKKTATPKIQKSKSLNRDYLFTTKVLLLHNGVEPETVDYVVRLLKEELSWRESLTKSC